MPVKCPGVTTFADGFEPPVPATLATPGVSIPDGVDPNYRTSYVHQYNGTIQKELAGNVLTVSQEDDIRIRTATPLRYQNT
jgi:hypothetical protein